MATIGKLNVKLNADTRRYLTKMKAAQGLTGKFKAGVLAAGAALKQFAVIGGIGAAIGLSVYIKRTAGAIDQTAKLARVIKSTVVQLEGLRLAANITGASSQSLDKGMQFLAKAVGEVSTGISTEATKAFELLGLSVDRLKSLSPADIFIEVSDGIKAIKSPSEQAAIAQRLLGRGGKELILTLGLGSRELRRFVNEAKAFGLGLDEARVLGVEAFNDSMTRLGTAMRGIGQQISIALLPAAQTIESIARNLALIGTFLDKLQGRETQSRLDAIVNATPLSREDIAGGAKPFDIANIASPGVNFIKLGLQASPAGLIIQTNILLAQLIRQGTSRQVIQ